jgi:uncharacterized protein YjbI with pentapeptide repeats
MKVFKPGRLGVLTRPFEHQRRFYMGFSVLVFVPLGRTDTILHEVAMWKFVAERLGKDAALDVAIPKSRGEFLVDGKAFAPSGVPHPAIPVRAMVGPLEKSLYVSGDRYWTGLAATNPMPFTEMKVDWAHAYGGPDYAKNPLGKGEVEVEIQGVKMRPLPNVESPRQLISVPNDRPEPAGFGPIDISWPQRSKLAGTHDQHWLENLFPGFARDVDWGIHNIAPRDQQREGFWEGGERFQFSNLHPSKPTFEGQLPRFRARVFISRTHKVGEPRPPAAETKAAVKLPPAKLDEVPLALQTLWFFPDAEHLVLIWQGSTIVAEEDGADVLHLLVAAEHADRPRNADHYKQVIVDRMDPEYGGLAALQDEGLLPEDLADSPSPTDEDRDLHASDNLMAQALHRRMTAESDKAREMVASYGLDPDVHGPAKVAPLAPPPKPKDLPALVEKAKKEAAAAQIDLELKHKQALADIDKIVDEAKIEGFTKETLKAEMSGKQMGPPTWTAAGQRADLERIAMDCRSQGVIPDELEMILADESVKAQWESAEKQMMESYRLQAHMQHPAPAMPSELRGPTRDRVRLALSRGEDFGTLNFTGADLSNMNLVGADLSNALLESAKLDGSDLSGAKLDNAVLAHASLVGTRLDGARLGKANLGKANLQQTQLAQADLREAILHGTVLDQAVLVGAELEGAILFESKWTKVDAREIAGLRLTFVKATLEASDFSGAKLEFATFLNNDLRGSTFDRALLRSCTFLGVKAQSVSFVAANLENARFVEASVLDEAKFTEATLSRANLRGTSLARAELRKAVLDHADFSECDLGQAKLYQASARETKFEVADLRNAEMISINCMHASFARATIYGADLRGANLYGADFARVRTDATVKLDQALLTKARVHPRHVEQEEGTS